MYLKSPIESMDQNYHEPQSQLGQYIFSEFGPIITLYGSIIHNLQLNL